MFKLKFAKMYDNSIFKKYNINPIAEDYFAIQDSAFCVADGVTRDSINGTPVPYPKNKEEAQKWVSTYPNPSGAAEAAKICSETFVKEISMQKEIDEQTISNVIKKVNKKIWTINEGRKIDYLAEDLYCCVAVGGIIVKNILYCFSIGDCHITALDKEFNTKFTTINNHRQFEDYLEDVYCKENNYDWNNPQDRIMVRRDYRNRPNKKYQGKEISFGVLSGEKEAEHYIDIYKVNLNDIKYICAYSDGCEPIFASKEKTQEILQNPEKLENEGKERTLIIYEKGE